MAVYLADLCNGGTVRSNFGCLPRPGARNDNDDDGSGPDWLSETDQTPSHTIRHISSLADWLGTSGARIQQEMFQRQHELINYGNRAVSLRNLAQVLGASRRRRHTWMAVVDVIVRGICMHSQVLLVASFNPCD